MDPLGGSPCHVPLNEISDVSDLKIRCGLHVPWMRWLSFRRNETFANFVAQGTTGGFVLATLDCAFASIPKIGLWSPFVGNLVTVLTDSNPRPARAST